MKTRILLFVYTFFALSILAAPVNGAESPEQDQQQQEEQPQVFTNQDIEKYSSSSDSKTIDTRAALKEDREERVKHKKKRVAEEHEGEHWCKRATGYRNKINKAEEAVKEAEDEMSDRSSKGIRISKKTANNQKKLEKAKKRLKSAEADLSELENEAHRKGIKPGWLRCDFD